MYVLYRLYESYACMFSALMCPLCYDIVFLNSLLPILKMNRAYYIVCACFYYPSIHPSIRLPFFTWNLHQFFFPIKFHEKSSNVSKYLPSFYITEWIIWLKTFCFSHKSIIRDQKNSTKGCIYNFYDVFAVPVHCICM